MTTTTYLADSRPLLAKARVELAQGDTRQASEKGWGAAALMVKAIAEQRGWEHRHHGLLTEAAERLSAETGNDDISDLFDRANALHINFYEDRLRTRTISRRLAEIERLLDLLEPLL